MPKAFLKSSSLQDLLEHREIYILTLFENYYKYIMRIKMQQNGPMSDIIFMPRAT